ncbi:hypothetical protein Pmani_035998 [Petrolisthes manimaculis]|uniref:Uncharacterized protein n=1 Tax=Petrolisthes manimaculis TaxID=1843537 RepID=A0AAE1TPV0_9EUCA|nr:hypothetical protein Pmani_035998 [Petrolisthes manimaculis]
MKGEKRCGQRGGGSGLQLLLPPSPASPYFPPPSPTFLPPPQLPSSFSQHSSSPNISPFPTFLPPSPNFPPPPPTTSLFPPHDHHYPGLTDEGHQRL